MKNYKLEITREELAILTELMLDNEKDMQNKDFDSLFDKVRALNVEFLQDYMYEALDAGIL